MKLPFTRTDYLSLSWVMLIDAAVVVAFRNQFAEGFADAFRYSLSNWLPR